METVFIEATHNAAGEGPLSGGNWGKFCVGRFTPEERARVSAMPGPSGPAFASPLLALCGWGGASDDHVWVLDLQTGEGAFFQPGGFAAADLEKHRVWVCPMFQPFLEWLYGQDLADLSALPSLVELPDAPFAFSGHRQPGPDAAAT